jgi:putative acetyltransferase
MSVLIRDFDPKDYESVKALYLSTTKDFPQIPEKYFYESLDKDLKDVSSFYQTRKESPKDGFFVVEDENKVIGGMVGLQYHSDKDAELRRMVISSEWRNKHLGVKLVTHLLDFAKEQGFSRVFLATSDYVTAARNLYMKCGFKESKQFKIEGYPHTIIEYEYLF